MEGNPKIQQFNFLETSTRKAQRSARPPAKNERITETIESPASLRDPHRFYTEDTRRLPKERERCVVPAPHAMDIFFLGRKSRKHFR
ncbi:hypothetical protein scyTo_0003384 [Scyliorhinus torazame]|uniref:Uncharacterized protein n=1 Tax=Scyliorhinus torazame TaxID=75743 RepID=A0A401PMG7_SCYTO|nr:hypothetical protein [Scyliorhinus torazame]